MIDSELLLKFIEYFPDYLSVLSRTLFWTTFDETAVFRFLLQRSIIIFPKQHALQSNLKFASGIMEDIFSRIT